MAAIKNRQATAMARVSVALAVFLEAFQEFFVQRIQPPVRASGISPATRSRPRRA